MANLDGVGNWFAPVSWTSLGFCWGLYAPQHRPKMSSDANNSSTRHARRCDDRVRIGACGQRTTGHLCVFKLLAGSYSLKRDAPVVGGSKFVCLSSKLGLPAVSEGFSIVRCVIEVLVNDSICSACNYFETRGETYNCRCRRGVTCECSI